MRHSRRFIVPCLLAAAGVLVGVGMSGAGHAQHAAAQSQFIPPTIAVIDMDVVLDGSQRRLQLEEEIKVAYQAKSEALESLKKEGQEYQTQLQLLKPGSEEYKQTQRKLGQKQTELEIAQKQASEDLERHRGDLFRKLLDEIRASTEEYAAAHGIDVVLQKKLMLQQDMPPWEAVLYCNANLDISKPILESLNGKKQ